MSSKDYGPYGKTPITRAGYLDILTPRIVPAAGDDVLYEIPTVYTHRPDLLAYDLYGRKELWWVFAQRNPDILIDPIYDFIAGVKIYLPQGKNLQASIGV